MRIILASASPRRAEILKSLLSTLPFEIIPPDGPETTNEKKPDKASIELAKTKAFEVLNRIQRKADETLLIIACDTIVYLDGEFIGKPKDRADAFETLKKLNGKTHEVYSGVCILSGRAELSERTFCECSKVVFRNNTERELLDYIDEFRPLDKAGSYGLQDGHLIKEYVGSANNIVGLPAERLEKALTPFLNLKDKSRTQGL